MVVLDRLRSRWLQILVHTGALLPLAWLLWQYGRGAFVIDAVRQSTTLTGKAALILLMLSLACTPLGALTGSRQVQRVRRPLGLYAFAYVALHFFVFVGLDYRFDLDLLPGAILDQRYVLVGTAAGLILLPLAITGSR